MSGITILHEEYGKVVSVGERQTSYCSANVSGPLRFFLFRSSGP